MLSSTLYLFYWFPLVYGGFGQVRSEGQNVAARQQTINSAYEQLLKKADERQKKLLDSIKRFEMHRECEELETWVLEKETVLKGEEKGTNLEQMESVQKKYDVRSYCLSDCTSQLITSGFGF